MQGDAGQTHRLVEDFITIDVVDLEKAGRLSPSSHDLIAPAGQRLEFVLLTVNSSGCEIELSISSGVRERVAIEETPCHFGGVRRWFMCPRSNCGRRCRKLYLQGSGRWLCRACADARYLSQRQSLQERRLTRARRLRGKMGGPVRPIDPLPAKPPHMHWSTWERRVRQISSLESEGISIALMRAERGLEQIEKRLAALSRGA
jgi:hypothetical protein